MKAGAKLSLAREAGTRTDFELLKDKLAAIFCLK
jgi:hypothetical protein